MWTWAFGHVEMRVVYLWVVDWWIAGVKATRMKRQGREYQNHLHRGSGSMFEGIACVILLFVHACLANALISQSLDVEAIESTMGYHKKIANQAGGPCGSHPHFSISAAACSAVYPMNTGPVNVMCAFSSFWPSAPLSLELFASAMCAG